uniref:UBX domain-containing protein 4 n=1 Tax=Syphacia muris TaxID=451379 RepID=A0A0N5AK99_9BILA
MPRKFQVQRGPLKPNKTMKWFEGEIPAAIAESRQKNGIFVVVVFQKQGTVQRESIEMEGYWNKIDSDAYEFPIVAIKVFDGTNPVPVIPSAYFIDPSGRTLDIMTLTNAPNQRAFVARLQSVMKKMAKFYGASTKLNSETTAKSDGNTKNSNLTSSCSNVVEAPSSSTAETTINKSDGNISSISEENIEVMPDKNASMTAQLSLEMKVKRAEELLNKKHKEDDERRRKEALEKEIERRNVGKAMAEAKAKRDEMEIQELAQQRRREKLENEKQLKRLREQIKADREERLRRDGRQTTVAPSPQPEIQCSITHRNNSHADCRIQAKFSNGDVMQFEFKPEDLFSVLVDKIKKEKIQNQDFVLKQSYPRRSFEVADYSSTFSELGLTPSATILVFPVRNNRTTTTKYTDFGISHLFSYIILPFQTLLNYIFSFVWPQTSPSITGTSSAKINCEKKEKKEGNMHRFHNQEDSSHESDDEPRWNGNSTELL